MKEARLSVFKSKKTLVAKVMVSVRMLVVMLFSYSLPHQV